MRGNCYDAYAPLQTIKPFADEIWIVDGPEIGMRFLGFSIPFPTRMTIVRLPGRAELGTVRHLIAPNTLHYSYLLDWQGRFPNARLYGPPGLEKKARRPISVDETLGEQAPDIWGGHISQCLIRGPALTEVDFFHHPSRTLILTDIIENFEPSRVRAAPLRWLMRVFGAADPDGKAPFDMQLSFIGRRRHVRAAASRIIGWAPERIILAHGRCYEANGVAELQRAFRWVLPAPD